MPVPGEFDDDEPTEILERVRSSKCAAPKAGIIAVRPQIPRNVSELPSESSSRAPTPVRRTQQVKP